MKRWIIIAILGVLCSGCNMALPGFRFAPGQEQRQSAQIAQDLAGVAYASGLPPRTAAAKALLAGARASAAYTGRPKEPVDISELVPPSIADAWHIKEQQVQAVKLKQKLQANASEIAGQHLADLLETIQDKAKIPASDVIHRVQAIVALSHMAAELSGSIEVPLDLEISAEEAQRLEALDLLIARLNAAGLAQALRRPTVEEVGDKVLESTDTVIDKIGGVLNDYGLLALIPGGAGVWYGAKKRKEARQQKEKADKAEAAANNSG